MLIFYQFQDLLHANLYILRDFNLHLENSNRQTNTFKEILTYLDLKQHINFPANVHVHWLDVLFTKRTSNFTKSVFWKQVFKTICR